MYHGICWLVPTFFMVLPLIPGDVYGDAGGWCWIYQDRPGWRFGTFYVWLMILFVVVTLAYIHVIKTLRKQSRARQAAVGTYQGESEAEALRRRRTEKKLVMYILAFIVLWLPGIINRVHQLAADRPVFALVFLHSVCVPLQGFCNSIIYASTEDGMLRIFTHPREAWTLLRARLAGGSAGGVGGGVQAYELSHKDALDELAGDGADDYDEFNSARDRAQLEDVEL
eukprot:TRINITY_DN6785_c0_g1_i1.p1 TRINITY_DN6785_c0_g1~~TRINITY_DN6785_c0_g1_i1.p1  ORF type:complete len:226 (-),score=86.79 TRINITY_DN6785_c0_g1_i1:33-710(-)